MRSKFDVSIVVTFHREGGKSRSTLLALERCRRHAARARLSTELIAVLDSPDEATAMTVRQLISEISDARLLEARYTDPALGRNLAISTASGRAIAIADGDDLLTDDWIAASVRRLDEMRWNAIVHPELVIEFGASSGVTRLPDMERDKVPLRACLTTHFWISTCVAPAQAFRELPYLACGKESAFGYEDWHWTCNQIAARRQHVTAPGTALLYRKKARSLLSEQESQGRIVRHSMLFSLPEFLRDPPQGLSAEPYVRPVAPARAMTAGVRALWAAVGGRRVDCRSPDQGARLALPVWLRDELCALASMDEELALHRAATSESWTWWYPKVNARLGDEYATAYKKLKRGPAASSWRLSRPMAECQATTAQRGIRISVLDASGAEALAADLGDLRSSQLTCEEESYLVTRLVLGFCPHTLSVSAGLQLLPNHMAAIRESAIRLEQDS